MAIAKIHAIKSTVAKSIEYITNPDKTIMPNGTQLVSSFNCATETAAIEFDLTRRMALEMTGDYTNTGRANNLAYHMIQSFDIMIMIRLLLSKYINLELNLQKSF